MTEGFGREDGTPILAAESEEANLFAAVTGGSQTNFLTLE